MNALRARYGIPALGALALLVSIAVTLFWYLGYAQEVFEGKGRTVRAEFAATPQLQEGDPVTVDGRREGRVRKIEDTGGGRGSLVTFDVSDDAGPLYADSVVQLRWKNLLGGAFYLEVDRGTPEAGDLGGRTIPRRRTASQVELDDVTTILQGRAMQGFTTLPGELSEGLRDPDAVAGLLDTTAEASPTLTRALRGVRGATPDADLRRLIRGAATTVQALDAPRDELRVLVEGAGSFVGTTAQRDAELRSVIGAGPQLTDEVRTTLARLDTTLEGADGLVARLERSADEIAPTLAALRPTLRSTDVLLADARPLLRSLRPASASLARLGRDGLPLLEGLQPSLDRLDDHILPFLARRDPETGKPTSVMIGGTAAGFGGSAGQQDTNGHFIRFPASAGDSSVYLPCSTALTNPTAEQLATCDSLDTALERYLEYVPRLSSDPGGER